MKRKHDWFVGTMRVLRSDLRVARLKNQRSASLWLFAIPLAMALGFMLWMAREDMQRLVFASSGLVATVSFMLLALHMRRTKARVYSTNSEVNISLNQSGRRSLSYMWLALAIIENFHFIPICLLIANENADMSGVWMALGERIQLP